MGLAAMLDNSEGDIDDAHDSTDAAPTAILERVSLVLDTFDGPGRLTLAQVVKRTGLPRSSAHRILERLVDMRCCDARVATTSWGRG